MNKKPKKEIRVLPVPRVTRSYNTLSQSDRDFSLQNRIYCSEYCIRNRDKSLSMEHTELDRKAGNGRFGFPNRRVPEDPVRIVIGLDGQYKKGRQTVVRRRKNPSNLWSTAQIRESSADPVKLQQIRKIRDKAIRAANRNHKARRGRK